MAHWGAGAHAATVDATWRRVVWALPDEAGPISLSALGQGRLEIAEVEVVALTLPSPAAPGPGHYATWHPESIAPPAADRPAAGLPNSTAPR